MKIYNAILQDHEATLKNARDYASGMAWCEVDQEEQQQPTHSRYVETVAGIGIYYDYAADYYYFTDEE